jgi:hypothetical protein
MHALRRRELPRRTATIAGLGHIASNRRTPAISEIVINTLSSLPSRWKRSTRAPPRRRAVQKRLVSSSGDSNMRISSQMRKPLPPGRNERVLAVCRDPDRRVRLDVTDRHRVPPFGTPSLSMERRLTGFRLGPMDLKLPDEQAALLAREMTA